MKILMKMRKLARLPLRTDDRNAPLVVGTPRTEQVAKKTENAAKERIETQRHCAILMESEMCHLHISHPLCDICDIFE